MPFSNSLHLQGQRSITVTPPTGSPLKYYIDGAVDIMDTFSGTSNPQWREQIEAYKDATTPASGVRYHLKWWQPATMDVVTKQSNGYSFYRGFSTYPLLYDASYHSDDVAFCDVRAREKFYSDQSDRFQGPAFFGELAETIAMLRSPAKALRKAVSVRIAAARKLRGRLLKDRRLRIMSPERRRTVYRKAWSESWLEWSLGISPLLNDIGSIMKDIHELSFAPNIQFFSNGHSEQRTFSVPRTRGVLFNGVSVYAAQEEHIKTSVRYRGAIYSLADVSTDVPGWWGFKSTEDYDCGVWEVIPYSWIVDYVFSIGDVFAAKAIAKNIRYVYCCKTVRVVNTRTRDEEFVYSGSNPIVSSETIPGFATLVRTDFNRTRELSVALPSVRMRNLSEFNAYKALNLGALLHLRTERELWLRKYSPFL